MLPSEHEAQKELGLRCHGCGEPIIDGYEWFGTTVAVSPDGGLVRVALTTTTCANVECPDYMAVRGSDGVIARRAIHNEWLVDPERNPATGGLELPPGFTNQPAEEAQHGDSTSTNGASEPGATSESA